MHVALTLFHWFPHGGMQRDALATAERCRDAGHGVRVYCHTWDGKHPEGIEVRVLPARGRTNHARARRFAKALQRELVEQPADVVVGFDKMPGLDLYFAADPCFVARTAHRPWPYRLTPRYRTFRALEGAVFGHDAKTRILLLDEREQPRYQAAWRTPAERFSPLPPGVARDRRKAPDAAERRIRTREQLGVADDETLLLLLGANFALKGLDRALVALASLPAVQRRRTRLVAAGEGPTPTMLGRARELGIADRVTLLPGRDDVPDLLQAADLLVHPARRDTTGTVLLEALVAGLPVLCTAACGYAARVAAAGAGTVLAEPFAQDDFDAALATLLAHPLEPLADRALAYAATHDLHGMHDRILEFVEQAGARSRAGAGTRSRPGAP